MEVRVEEERVMVGAVRVGEGEGGEASVLCVGGALVGLHEILYGGSSAQSRNSLRKNQSLTIVIVMLRYSMLVV